MNVAILSINLGEYTIFWKKFYESIQENFLPDCPKTYYVFTDADEIDYSKKENVHIIPHEDMGWPYNTMKRFHLFISIKNELEKFDYIFFANANAEFLYPMTDKFILPQKSIIAVEHPGRHGDPVETIPFERRKESRAYVSLEDGKIYVQGAFFGGKSNAFIAMCETLDRLTEEDLGEGIIAVVHDESFLNRYIAGRKDVQILGWQYLYFENVVRPYIPVIQLRSKFRYLSKRNARYKEINRLKSGCLGILRNLKWWVLIKLNIYKWYDVVDKKGNYLDLDISERKRVPNLKERQR